MPVVASAVVPMGVLLPDSILRNDFIAVLAAFVAINTIVYVTLAVAKILPKFYLRDWLGDPQHPPRRRHRRADRRHAQGPPRAAASSYAGVARPRSQVCDRSNMCADSRALTSATSRRQRGRANNPRRKL